MSEEVNRKLLDRNMTVQVTNFNPLFTTPDLSATLHSVTDGRYQEPIMLCRLTGIFGNKWYQESCIADTGIQSLYCEHRLFCGHYWNFLQPKTYEYGIGFPR